MLEIAYYISFLAPDGRDLSPANARQYQNFFIGATRSYDGKNYLFAPFALSGDLSNQGAEAGEAELIAPANIMIGAVAWEAVNSRYLVQIRTMLLTATEPTDSSGIPVWSETGLLACDIRSCDSLSYADTVPGEDDATAVFTLKLVNPLNNVVGSSPTRRLRNDQVGALPSSGGIIF